MTEIVAPAPRQRSSHARDVWRRFRKHRGAMIGAVLGDPKRLGADFAFTALFIALVAAFWKGRVTFWTVAAAGIASAVTYRLAGPPWHVAAGALCGLLAAWLAAGSEEQPATEEAKA